jgi:hypothetical protein
MIGLLLTLFGLWVFFVAVMGLIVLIFGRR